MAKKILRISDEDKFDFSLIGIICHHRDYRLSMALNKKLELDLCKQEEYTVFNNKRMEDQAFSFYEYINEEDDRFNLISNKSLKGFLLPEQNQIDFLFILRMIRVQYDLNEIIQSMKEIPIILGAYVLDTVRLKSRENLVF
jgi:hypothetical protein